MLDLERAARFVSYTLMIVVGLLVTRNSRLEGKEPTSYTALITTRIESQ